MIKEFQIVQSGVEEGVDLGIESKILLLSIWCQSGEFFYCSMLCKWMTSLVDST
jgi:hypothetical protein